MTNRSGAVSVVPRSSVFLVYGVLGLGAVALLGGVVLDWADRSQGDALLFVPYCAAFATVGAAIVLRGGSGTMGALFLFSGTEVALSLLLGSYAGYAAAHGLPGAAWSGVGFVISIWLSFPVALILQLFPDGRAFTPGGRALVWATVAVGVLGIVASGLSAQDDFISNFPTLQHPADVLPRALGLATYEVAQLALLAAVLASAVVVGLRYRRSRGVERQQMTWLVAAGALAAVGFVTTGLFVPWGIEPVLAWAILMPLVPVACGFAILRYRLYEIDRIISRTLAYALVTGVLLTVYAIVVTSVTRLLPGTSNSFGVATATLAAAATFRPVLRKVRASVDRRFNRARYDAQRTVEAFAARLRDEVDPEAVSADLLAVLGQTLQPAGQALWMRGVGK